MKKCFCIQIFTEVEASDMLGTTSHYHAEPEWKCHPESKLRKSQQRSHLDLEICSPQRPSKWDRPSSRYSGPYWNLNVAQRYHQKCSTRQTDEVIFNQPKARRTARHNTLVQHSRRSGQPETWEQPCGHALICKASPAEVGSVA